MCSLCGDVIEIIVTHSEKVASHRGGVVGLGRMGQSVGLCKEDTLGRELLESGRSDGDIEVGVLNPNLGMGECQLIEKGEEVARYDPEHKPGRTCRRPSLRQL